MTARQPRRTRRRDLPAESLPRLRPEEERERRRLLRATSVAGERRHINEHHVVTDYRYVKPELLAITAVTAVTMAFVVGMSFVL
jgi:hypothetical protein